MILRNADRFIDLLRTQKISQRKLAESARVSQPYISLLLKGKRGARAETAWRISSALGVFTEELFQEKDENATQVTDLRAVPLPSSRASVSEPIRPRARMRVQPRLRREVLATAA